MPWSPRWKPTSPGWRVHRGGRGPGRRRSSTLQSRVTRVRYWIRVASLCGVVAFLYFGAKHVEQWTPPTGGQASASCSSGPLTGEVTYVRDGDTIEVAGVPIRLGGLAAPESDEPAGRAATVAMRRLVDGRELRCELNGERTYDRCVGVCYLGGKDIATKLVREGVARDCPRYSRGRYAQAERRAAAEGATIRGQVSASGVLSVALGNRSMSDHWLLVPEDRLDNIQYTLRSNGAKIKEPCKRLRRGWRKIKVTANQDAIEQVCFLLRLVGRQGCVCELPHGSWKLLS